MARGPSFDPRPFAGTNAPPGASPEALRELEKMMQADEEREAVPAPTRKRGRPSTPYCRPRSLKRQANSRSVGDFGPIVSEPGRIAAVNLRHSWVIGVDAARCCTVVGTKL